MLFIRLLPTLLFLVSLATLAVPLTAQSYTSYFTGDTTDVSPGNFQAGILLAGGGPDSDAAMRWLLQRADGGDILILRASGSDGYNDYLYEDLGEAVNSVETIRFDGPAAANDPYVLRRILEAEAIFFAGGNQSTYVDYWRDSPVQDALNEVLLNKGITFGGTSAGMAILSGIYYAPENQSLISVEALSDPYHPNTAGFTNQPFLEAPYLTTTFTDTHFEQRDRQGRTLVFLARAFELAGANARGISANEASALAIDENGIARAFGEFPVYDDYIFLLAPGCTNAPNGPEQMVAGEPITWNRNGQAVSVYRMPADINGAYTFDLNSWMPLDNGGNWEYWTANDGLLSINESGAAPVFCQPSSTRHFSKSELTISPQPVGDLLTISGATTTLARVEIIDAQGKILLIQSANPLQINTSSLRPGLYFLRVFDRNGDFKVAKLMKQ